MSDIVLDYGNNDIVTTTDGRRYIDFVAGFGSVILGHANPHILAAVQAQSSMLWNSAHLAHSAFTQCQQAINQLLPERYRLGQLYSTGMEATEFCLRMASILTSRRAYAGFEKSMHGKSLATSSLCWANGFRLDDFHSLPFVREQDEAVVLQAVEELFANIEIAALFIEPLQGSAGGLQASENFYRTLVELCKQHGVISIFDEILTGFYRTGDVAFCFAHDIYPDVVVFGKSMGNGFPVSAVVARDDLNINASMLPGSTFAGNPLACAAVKSTLEEFQKINIKEKVQYIAERVQTQLAPIREQNFTLRGRGALWIIEPPSSLDTKAIADELLQNGTLISYTPAYLRIIPPATISHTNLQTGLQQVCDACVHTVVSI